MKEIPFKKFIKKSKKSWFNLKNHGQKKSSFQVSQLLIDKYNTIFTSKNISYKFILGQLTPYGGIKSSHHPEMPYNWNKQMGNQDQNQFDTAQ